MYSDKEANLKKVGWIRGGQDIKYYRNNLRFVMYYLVSGVLGSKFQSGYYLELSLFLFVVQFVLFILLHVHDYHSAMLWWSALQLFLFS